MISYKDICVVVPLYRNKITNAEKMSLEFLFKFLSKYHIYFVVPDKLKTYNFGYKKARFMSFPSKVFKNRNSYNKFLLNRDFYLKFAKYKFMLIYQLDSLVFSDQLRYWCNLGYDYVAAPWFHSVIEHFTKSESSKGGCGNGGFCIRNIPKTIKILDIATRTAKRKTKRRWLQVLWFFSSVVLKKSNKSWLKAPPDNYPFNEDGFWSLEAPKYLSSYKVAPFDLSLKFAFERFPKKCFELNSNSIPFGVHAWQRYDQKFWLNLLSNNEGYVWSHYLKICTAVYNHR